VTAPRVDLSYDAFLRAQRQGAAPRTTGVSSSPVPAPRPKRDLSYAAFLRSQKQEEPSFLEGLGATARGVPAAINTTVASTLGKLSRVPTMGRDNPVSRFFSEVETGGREAFRPADPRLQQAYEMSEAVGRLPAEIGKYAMTGGPIVPAALGAAEAIGSTPEESEAAFLGGLAGRFGMTGTQQALESASRTPLGRALTSAAMSVVPDALMRGGTRGAERLRTGMAARQAQAPAAPTPRPMEAPSAPAPSAAATGPAQLEMGFDLPQTPVPEVKPTTMPKATMRAQALMQPSEIEGVVNFRTFSDDPLVQDRMKAAASKFVSEVDTPMRVTQSDKAQGRFPGKKVGDLINSESLDEVREKVAADLALNPVELVERTKNGERLDRFDLLRVRTAINDVLAEEDALFKQLDSRSLTDDETAKVNFRLSQLDQERNALMETFTTQRTGTARDLNALKATALRTADPIAWIARAQKLAQRPLSDAERAAIREAADLKDLEKLNQIASDLQKFTWQDKFRSLYTSGLLTAPKTYAANILGNTAMAGLETAKEFPATFFDRVLSAWTGVETKSLSSLNPITMAKVSADGAKKGGDNAIRVAKGERPADAPLELSREVRYDNKFLDWYTRVVSRSLSAPDQFFRGMATVRSLDEQARAMAKAEKLTGDAFTQRVNELRARPTDEMAMRSVADAEIATFQENSALARAAEGARDFLNKAPGGVLGDILIPFRRTPANIAKRIYEYSVLNAVSLKNLKRAQDVLLRRIGADEQREFVNALGRASVGSGIIGLGYILASEGRMTGFFPTTQRERDAWDQQGKLEGALKIDDKSPWVQVAKYSPFGNLLQVGAQMYNIDQDLEVTPLGAKWITANVTAPLKSAVELPMVANINDLIDVGRTFGTAESGEAAMKIAGRTATGLLPFAGLARAVTGGIDPYVRETKAPTVPGSLKAQVMNVIPGVSQKLPPRVDPLGKIQERPYGLLGSIFAPSQIREDVTKTDPVVGELARTGAVIGRLERGKQETPDQYAMREQIIGNAVRTALANVIARDPQYRALGNVDPARARLLMEAYNQTRNPDEQIDVSRLSDERIVARLQGNYLERQAENVKNLISRMSRRGQQKLPSNIESAMKAVIR
jgi:hypothetical protein